ncbi:MAG: hypothetical protein PHN64_08870 [Desulfovibrionaceae bacterium]|nr:hypothetical protein [Desulfovibrionaceae bacterium]
MNYIFAPVSAQKINFMISPQHLISIEDAIILMKYDVINILSEAIMKNIIKIYFYKKSIFNNNIEKMICYPINIKSCHRIEYNLTKYRLFFLKRDLRNFIENNQNLISDNILEIPEERIATKKNYNKIINALIHRTCIKASLTENDNFEKIFYLPLLCIYLLIVLFKFIISALYNKSYTYKNIPYYNGNTLRTFSIEDAKQYYIRAQENNKDIDGVQILKKVDLRALLSVELYEGGLSRDELLYVLHDEYGANLTEDSKLRTVSSWLQRGKEMTQKRINYTLHSLSCNDTYAKKQS